VAGCTTVLKRCPTLVARSWSCTEATDTTSPAAAEEPDSGKLSPRKAEVLRLTAKGRTNEQIARELLLSTSTVKNHGGRILSKLEASDRTQAAITAIEKGLISISL